MTKHKPDCKMVFGKKDPSCPRCQELLNGAPPRDGWQKSYYRTKALNDAIWKKALAEHDCKKAGCMPICTFGDW